jgi:glycosyltransferase 2 family protein
MSRAVRIGGTLVVTVLGTAYILWKADVRQALDLIAEANGALFAAAVALTGVTVVPMAWRWQRLLRAKGIHDRLGWLTRAYFVAYTAGQILPTTVGGDALRIYETSRRHPGRAGTIAGSVLLERALGGAATLALAAVGFVLAYGQYDVGAYLWLEGALVAATAALAVLLFSRRLRPLLARSAPLLRKLRLERPVRAVYEGIHSYRGDAPLLLALTALTLVVQAVRILAIWLTAEAVGADLPVRLYFVMGPLLFLVMLIPFTINGLAVRESFFVSFFTTVGESADVGLAAGLLFFLVTVVLALPGLLILAVESVRGGRVPETGPKMRPNE